MGMLSCLVSAMLYSGAQDFVHFPAMLLPCLWPYDKDAAASLVKTIGLGQFLYIKLVKNAA